MSSAGHLLDFSTLLGQFTKEPQYSSSENTLNRGVCSSGWVSRPSHVDMMDFALANLPSTWHSRGVAWISLRNFTANSNNENKENGYCGKWMWFIHENEVDEKFLMLADALQNGMLGHSIKVSPVSCRQCPNNPQDKNKSNQASMTPFIIYTKDFRDRDDVLRVGLALRKLGNIHQTISYKPGTFSVLPLGFYLM